MPSLSLNLKHIIRMVIASRITMNACLFAQVNLPDIAIINANNTTQSENSVFISPVNPNVILNSNNSTDFPIAQIFGTSGFFSNDGGNIWVGQVAGTGGNNLGDPAAVIDRNGFFYIGYIAIDEGQGVARSIDGGINWAHIEVAEGPAPGGVLDKNHLWVDNREFTSDGAMKF